MLATYNAKRQTTSLRPPGALGMPLAFEYAGNTQDERVKVGGTKQQNNLLGLGQRTPDSSLPAPFEGLGTTYYTRDPANVQKGQGNLFSQRTPNGRQYYLQDALGSVVGLTDQQGGLVAKYRYDPFGRELEASGVAAPGNPFRFAGEQLDSQTGHYKLPALLRPGAGALHADRPDLPDRELPGAEPLCVRGAGSGEPDRSDGGAPRGTVWDTDAPAWHGYFG